MPAKPYTHQLSAVDVTNDGCVELPIAPDPSVAALKERCAPSADTAKPPQATFQQVVRWVVTHELGHAVGSLDHTNDPTDVMCACRETWTSDAHFSDDSASTIHIENRATP